jgi:hypothetical protein
MSLIPGTVPVAGEFAPTDSADVYGLYRDTYMIGSHRAVSTLSERNAIPSGRRKWGMLATVAIATAYVTYQLTEGTVDSDLNNNANWVVFATGGTVTINNAEVADFAGPLTADDAVSVPADGFYKDVSYDLATSINPLTGITASGSGKKYVIQNFPSAPTDPDNPPSIFIPHVNGATYELIANNFVILSDVGVNNFRIVRI